MNSAQTERPSQPNILFILSDDQGFFDVGYQGSEIMTPNIDQLAKDGVKLENYYITQGKIYDFLDINHSSKFGRAWIEAVSPLKL